MPDERDANDGVDRVLGCSIAVLLLCAAPAILVAVWGILGSALGDVAGLVGAAIAAVVLVVGIIRLSGGGR